MSSSVSRSPQRLQFIDWARALAIISVLLYHSALAVVDDAMRWRGYWWDPGALPLDVSILNVVQQWLQIPSLFFLISGYLVHRSMARHPGQGAGILLLRRGMRLYLPYLIVLVFYGLVWPRTRISATYDGALDGLSHALLVHNYGASTLYSINGSFWYVAVELQLCALYPLVIAATRRFGWNRTMAGLLAIELVTRILGSVLASGTFQGDLNDALLMRWPGAFLLTWNLGAWIAELQRTERLKRPGAGWIFFLPALGAAMLMAWPLSGLVPLVMAMSYGAGLAWLLTRPDQSVSGAQPSRPGSFQRTISALGSLTLGIYLLNQPVIHELERHVSQWIEDPFLKIVTSAGLALLLLVPVSWLMARLVEKPLGGLVDSWLEKHSRARISRIGAVGGP